MTTPSCAAVILAAGQGTRMKSSLPKVLHRVAGAPLAAWPASLALELDCVPTVLVVGHGADQVKKELGDERLAFALQAEQLGTGHALLCAEEALRGFRGTILLLCGDVPLLRRETLEAMLQRHSAEQASVSLLTAVVDDPTGYGRIVRDGEQVKAIVEQKDASVAQREICEINAGIYAFEAPWVFEALKAVGNDNAQKEYYLTDIVAAANNQNRTVCALVVDEEEVMGINDRVQLAEAASVMRQRINEQLMRDGVTLVDPDNCYIDGDVRIGVDTIIHPNVHLRGATTIGTGCLIEPGVVVTACRIGNNVHLKAGSVLAESTVGDDCAIGPMAHLRPGTHLAGDNKIGNFVETKKANFGPGSQASHLTYIGDAEVGRNVNFGCGTITCNYDGVNKHVTEIGDDVFVGSDVQFIAPVKIGSNSLIGAGSTITKDVPPDALAISRAPQKNIEGWAKKNKKTKK